MAGAYWNSQFPGIGYCSKTDMEPPDERFNDEDWKIVRRILKTA